MITERQVLDILKGVIDPDIGINIVDLGLIERVSASAAGIEVALIMTTPACPQSGYLGDECARVLREAGAGEVTVSILAQPLWEPARLSDTARQALGWGV